MTKNGMQVTIRFIIITFLRETGNNYHSDKRQYFPDNNRDKFILLAGGTFLSVKRKYFQSPNKLYYASYPDTLFLYTCHMITRSTFLLITCELAIW
jgi:hypothetical protein